MRGRFSGQVAVITGAGRGMGRTIAEALVSEGAKVVIGARTIKYGEQAVANLKAGGAEAVLCQVDVTSRADVFSLIDTAVSHFRKLDIIVHSAAESHKGRVVDISDEDVEQIFASNLKAAFWLTKAGVPHLSNSAKGGRIVMVSSICGPRTAIAGHVAYGTAKAGLNAFIAGAAVELGPQNITVNGVEPGTTSTDRMRSQVSEAQARKIASTVPMGRIGEPADIADAVLFLASPRAGYITGTTITVDGGLSLSTMNLAGATEV
jgi:3-oxoacyl-[acyl-carrier protein] reductase